MNVWVDAESRLREIEGSGIFLSCSRRPISMNSVLEGSGTGDLMSSRRRFG